MDEGLDGEGHRARPGDNKAPQRVGIHRVNDFVLGHVGQVSYRPVAVDEAEVGDLDFSRIDEHPPSCQQLMPFEEWFAPTRSSLALPTSTSFHRSRSQKNWLFKTHPEAFLGNLDLPGLISEETRVQKARGWQTQTGSLLAIGEIHDLRNTGSSRAATCPVVALAAGEAGHILQLSAIKPEIWNWNESSFALGASQSNFQGVWSSDGSPISKLGFATKLKQSDTLRWLIAQKDTSTTIFEPELRAKPAAVTTPISGVDGGPANHIVLNPVATLTANVTGGEAHCDFSVNLGSNDLAPEIAIIDRSGNWSVWYIARDGHGRSRTTKAMLMKKGSWGMPLPTHVDSNSQSGTYRIVWTTRASRNSEWERDSSPSAQSDSLAGAHQAAYLADLGLPRPIYDGLLMCNHTQLQALDVDGARLPSSLDFSRRDGIDTILDAQTFLGSSSHVFVLTTDKLHLLDVSIIEGQEVKAPKILASCRHFRNISRESLKLSITKLQAAHGEAGALVSIHSAHSFRVDLFWFIVSQRKGIAKFHRQVVNFPGLNTASTGEPQGIESLAAIPLRLAPSKGKGRHGFEEDNDRYAHAADVQLYQLFALTADLSLRSSVVALTQDVQQKLATPVKADSLLWNDERRARFLRRKWLRETEQAFVIPDKAEGGKPLSLVHVPSQVEQTETVQLRFYLRKLVEEINRAYVGDAADGPVKLTGAEQFKSIRKALKSREEDEHIALKPLLSFSDMWMPFNLSTLDDAWGHNTRQLDKSQQTQVFQCGIYGPTHSVMDLFEKISIKWSASLPAETLRTSQWKYMELALERMAAEVYMSERSVYMVPQSTLDLASRTAPRAMAQVEGEHDADVFPSSQPHSSQVLPTPSVTPSSSRATSEAMDSTTNSQEDEATGLEDPAVARLRMYLPSIKFTPPPKSGPSRIISLWPEQRGADPFEYRYRPPGQGLDERVEARKRRREREEERRRRRAEKRALLGIKMEGVGESYSQPYQPTMIRSSPPPQDVGSSQHQAHSQGFGGFGFGSQSQRQDSSQGFGFSQNMSQPLPGEFGGRPRLKKRMGTVKIKRPGFL